MIRLFNRKNKSSPKLHNKIHKFLTYNLYKSSDYWKFFCRRFHMPCIDAAFPFVSISVFAPKMVTHRLVLPCCTALPKYVVRSARLSIFLTGLVGKMLVRYADGPGLSPCLGYFFTLLSICL